MQVAALEAAGMIEIKGGQKCWKGYEKKGTKMMFGKRYNNCVKKKATKEEVEHIDERMVNVTPNAIRKKAAKQIVKKDLPKIAAGAAALGAGMAVGDKMSKNQNEAVEVPDNVKKIPKELDKAVALHSSQRDRINSFLKRAKASSVKKPVSEDRLRINQNGHTYKVTLTWRGKSSMIQLFIPSVTRPTRLEVEQEIQKIYPEAKVLQFIPAAFDPADPTVMVPEEYISELKAKTIKSAQKKGVEQVADKNTPVQVAAKRIKNRPLLDRGLERAKNRKVVDASDRFGVQEAKADLKLAVNNLRGRRLPLTTDNIKATKSAIRNQRGGYFNPETPEGKSVINTMKMRADATPMAGRSSRSQVDADAIAAKFRGLKKKASRGKKKETIITSGGNKYSNMAANRKSIHPPTQEKAQNEFTDAKIDVGMRRAKRKSDVIKNLNRQFNKEENIQEDDMKGMSVKSGHKRPTEKGAGMTAKGVAAYRRRNPGSKLKTAVTGKVKKGSKAAKRRKSYCARSAGQMKKFPKAAKDPNSRLRQARRRWKC